MQPQKTKAPENELKKEEVSVNGKEAMTTKVSGCHYFLLVLVKWLVKTVYVVCLGEVKSEGKSLMEQLRGEALKFHKPGNLKLIT